MAYIKKGTKPYRIDLKDKIFGRLKVLEYVETRNHNTYWKCICDCGKTHITSCKCLINLSTISCGCYKREVDIKRKTKHGMYNTRIHSIWRHILDRCENPNSDSYKYYGALGIKVCDRWHSFENFYEDTKKGYADNLSIDRYPNMKGDYEPTNFRWATRLQQSRNIKSNVRLEYNGENLTYGEWADKLNFAYSSIGNRLRRGWSLERTLTEPINTKCRKKSFLNKNLN